MFHFFQSLATKIIAVVASAIIAVGIVHVPQIPNAPVQITHELNTPVIAGVVKKTSTSTAHEVENLKKQIDELKAQDNKASTPKSLAAAPKPADIPAPLSPIPPPPSPPPTPAQEQVDSNNSKNVADLVTIIDKAAVDLADDKTQIVQLSGKMLSDYKEFSPYLNATQAGVWNKEISNLYSQLDSLYQDIFTYEKSLSNTKRQILATKNLDYQYWLNTGVPDIVSHQKKYKEQLLNLTSTYSQSLNTTKNAITSNVTPSPTQLPQQSAVDPAIAQFLQEVTDYNNKLATIKQQLVQEYTAAGGFWTASQLEYNAMQKLKDMGIKPPTSIYGGPISSSGGYSSTQCNYLQGGYDCTSSDGSRTQAIPNGNGGYEIRRW